MVDDFPYIELEYVIRNMKFNVAFEDGFYDDAEQKAIKQAVDVLGEEMCIDRSYVDAKCNKHASTFMVEDGWVALKNLMMSTHFGRDLHPSHHSIFVDAVANMSLCYIYECLSTMGHDVDHLGLTVKEAQTIEVLVCEDVSNDWKSYQGRWQDWNVGEDGRFYIKPSEVNKKTRKRKNNDKP